MNMNKKSKTLTEDKTPPIQMQNPYGDEPRPHYCQRLEIEINKAQMNDCMTDGDNLNIVHCPARKFGIF